ncbi:MAG: GtrA family protein [Motiliproteus sp.]
MNTEPQTLGQKLCRPLRFVSVGVVNTVVGLSIIYSAMAVFKLTSEAANVLGYSCALLLSFVLNKRWTFRHQGQCLAAAGRFSLVILVAYGANFTTLILLTKGLELNPYLAQAVAIIPYTLLTYVGSRNFAFRTNNRA